MHSPVGIINDKPEAEELLMTVLGLGLVAVGEATEGTETLGQESLLGVDPVWGGANVSLADLSL